MLQPAEQRPEGPDNQAQTVEALRFLIVFTRELIRNNPSEDVLFLSMNSAAQQANITKDQAQKFISWVLDEKSKSPWPKGFF